MPPLRRASRTPDFRAGGTSLTLFALVVYKDAHYTAFVKDQNGWTYHDRRTAVAVGGWKAVIDRCHVGNMLPYLLFYDDIPPE